MGAMPPLLPHQIQTADGVVHGSPSLLTVTVTVAPGGRAVVARSSEPGGHYVDFGVPDSAFTSDDNEEAWDYAADGTYTVTMSNGAKSGSAQVTVPGV